MKRRARGGRAILWPGGGLVESDAEVEWPIGERE